MSQKSIDADYGASGDGAGNNDNAQEFRAFRDDMAANQGADSVELSLTADAEYWFGSGNVNTNRFTEGIRDLTIRGNGATLISTSSVGQFAFGGIGQIANASNSAMIETVAAGSRVLQLVESHISRTSLFIVGRWICVTGVDIQGIWNSPFGFPSNAQFVEFVKILDVGAGRIVIDRPLRNSYKSTWPRYNSGSSGEVDAGGPATVYALHSSWDARNHLLDVISDQPGQINAKIREITLEDCAFPGSSGGSFPSENLIYRAIRCDYDEHISEVDKLVTTVIYNNCQFRKLDFQSSSVDTAVILACDFSLAQSGSPKHAIMRGRKSNGSRSSITSFQPGAITHGYTEIVDTEGYDIASFGIGGHVTDKSDTWTIADGIIRIPNTEITGDAPLSRVLVPGARVFWERTITPAQGQACRGFHVLDATQDATYVYFHTDWVGDFPDNVTRLRSHPCPRFRMRDCIGTDEVVDLCGAPEWAPLFSYSSRTHSPSTLGALGARRLWGDIVSIKVNVTVAADSANANARLRLAEHNNYPYILADQSVSNTWGPEINLKVVGERVIRPSTAGGTTGAQSGDSDLTMPADTMWSPGSINPYLRDNLTGTPPTFSIEIITDQGFDSSDTEPAFKSVLAVV